MEVIGTKKPLKLELQRLFSHFSFRLKLHMSCAISSGGVCCCSVYCCSINSCGVSTCTLSGFVVLARCERDCCDSYESQN